VRIEYFKNWFCVVDLILRLNSRKQSLELDQRATFLFEVDDFAHSAKIAEDVVEAVVIIVFRQWSHEEYFWRTVLE